MKLSRILLISFMFISSQELFSQREFLVSVNPATGVHTFIKDIPGVNFILSGNSTFDENNSRFIFLGANSNLMHRLFSVDITSGNTISSPLFPVGLSPLDNIGSLIFNNTDSTLYGLLYLDSSQTTYLVSIDAQTGIHSAISSIAGVQYVQTGTETIDEINDIYSFIASDISGLVSKLYSVDLTLGTLISNPNFPNSSNMFDGIFNIKQDTLNNLIGIFDDDSSSTLSLVNIDRTNGVYSYIDTLRDFSNYIPFQSVYNKYTNAYSFNALDLNSNSRYYSYNSSNGSLISNPLYPILPDTNDNITELQIDNSTGIIYGLYWDNNFTIGLNELEDLNKVSIFPNPTDDVLNIKMENELIHNIELFNNAGQLVVAQKGMSNKSLKLNLEDVGSGIYYLRISSKSSITSRKVIIK
jgi:hypothetical protein